MGCLKRLGKEQARTMLRRSSDIQEFQYREFLSHGRDELLQSWDRHLEADAAHAITVTEGEVYSFFIFCGDVVVAVFENVIDNERKGG
jgi:hypothetical protein